MSSEGLGVGQRQFEQCRTEQPDFATACSAGTK